MIDDTDVDFKELKSLFDEDAWIHHFGSPRRYCANLSLMVMRSSIVLRDFFPGRFACNGFHWSFFVYNVMN